MSYLSRPRLALFGQFQADVSTVNNDVRHFSNKDWEDRFQQKQQGDIENGWWNPDGTGAFRLVNVTVRAALSSTGLVADDPVLRAALSGQADQTSAKIVDLDPQYQLASAIFGLNLTLASGGKPFFHGRFRTTPFRDLFFGRSPAGGSGGASAKFTSVLEEVEWFVHDHVGPPCSSGDFDPCLAARVRLAPSIPDHLDRARRSMPAPTSRRILACWPATVAIVPPRQIALAALGRLTAFAALAAVFLCRRSAEDSLRPSTPCAENSRCSLRWAVVHIWIARLG